MYKRMSWVKLWLLNVVTCGIYGLWAWNVMGKQQNDMAGKVEGKQIMGYITAWLLGFVTLGIVPFVWQIKFCIQENALAEAKGVKLTFTNNSFLIWLLLCVPVLSFYVLAENHNKLCEAYEG